LTEEPQESTEHPPLDRWTLIRDVALFQLKLVMDGARDLMLVPASLLAALVALLKSDPTPGTEFYDLLRLGRRSERWINLFAAADRVHGPQREDAAPKDGDIDQIADTIETYVVGEFKRSGAAQDATDRIGHEVRRLLRNGGRSTPPKD